MIIKELKDMLKELIKSKQVDVVIGYKRASDGVSAAPCLVDNENDIEQLIWDAYCVYNLSNYLKDFKGKRAAIFAKTCDAKSITVLIQENQLKREEVFIIGVECAGVIAEIGFEEKCKSCGSSAAKACDFVLKETKERVKVSESQERDEYEPVRKLEAKSLLERLKFWQEEFSRCIRCYACRQICPMCYCPRCVADQDMPAWFSKANSLEANFSWNVTRAMHLSGRCIDCGECERACPVGIPLREINKKIEKDIKELFKYEAGLNAEDKPFLSCFDKGDSAEFIR